MQFALIGRLILCASSLDSFIKNPVDRSGPARALFEPVGAHSICGKPLKGYGSIIGMAFLKLSWSLRLV
jgi:hypothetical protein